MVVKVSDASGEAYLSVFNEQAEKIIGCSADQLNDIKSQVLAIGLILFLPLISPISATFNVTEYCSFLVSGGRWCLSDEAERSHMGTSSLPGEYNSS